MKINANAMIVRLEKKLSKRFLNVKPMIAVGMLPRTMSHAIFAFGVEKLSERMSLMIRKISFWKTIKTTARVAT